MSSTNWIQGLTDQDLALVEQGLDLQAHMMDSDTSDYFAVQRLETLREAARSENASRIAAAKEQMVCPAPGEVGSREWLESLKGA